MNMAVLFAFAVYVCVLFAISLIFYHKARTASAFMVGGRSLNYWVTAISAQSSDMGPWLFLGFPAAVFMRGSAEIWTALGLIFFMYISWQYLAPAIRKKTEDYNALTLWTYFERKYEDKTNTIRVLSAFIAILFFVFYLSSGLVSLGRIMETSFGISYSSGVLIAVIATCAYILIGGFLAVAWCNLFQGLFLLAMIIIVPIVAYMHLGSNALIINNASIRSITLNCIPLSFTSLLQGIGLAAGWGLGYFGQPHIIVNFMAIDDVKNIKYAKYVGIIWQTLALSASYLIGIIGIGIYSFKLTNQEELFSTMITDYFNPLLVGFVLCGVFAAALSSINTQLIVAASAASEDLYKTLVAPHAGSKQLAWISRVCIILIGMISTGIALLNTDSIYNLVFYAWSGLGCAFGPLVMLSLYSDKINKYGAIVAILVGALIALVLPSDFNQYKLVTGFIAGTVSAYGVSALTSRA